MAGLLLVAALVVATLIMATFFFTQSGLALNSKGEACKNNHKNSDCVHISSGVSDPQNNVPFVLPFP